MAWRLQPRSELPAGHTLEVVETAELACQSLANLLPLAARLKVSPSTGNLTADGVRVMLAALPEGDLYRWPAGGKAVDTIRPFGWTRLLQGLGSTDQSLPEILRDLWRAYLKTRAFDEFDRISAIHGWQKKRRRVTPVVGRRQALANTLAALPDEQWVGVDDYFSLVLATDNDFEVARDLESLYVGGSEWFGNLARHREHLCLWEVVQGRFALAFLMEYAGTLGLVDLAYGPPEYARGDFRGFYATEALTHFSRYDGLAFIRLNALGRYLLGLSDSYAPAVRSGPICLRLDELSICGSGVPRSVRTLLEVFALSRGEERWELTRASLAAAAQRVSLAQVELLLQGHSEGPLPAAVRQLLDDCRTRFRELHDCGLARLVEMPPRLLERLLGDARIRKLCLRAGEGHLVIPQAHETQVRRILVELGYPIGSLDPASPAPDWERLSRELEASLL